MRLRRQAFISASAVYMPGAFSTKPVMAEMGLSLSETTWAFSIAILFLGLSAGFLGGIVERLGAQVGTGFCLFLRLCHAGDGISRLCEVGGAPVPVLRMYRRNRTGNRVYHSGIHTGEMVPSAPRFCYGSGYYGIWICCSY